MKCVKCGWRIVTLHREEELCNPCKKAMHLIMTKDFGVTYCVVCECEDTSLTTECPGVKLGCEVQQQIHDGHLDFQNRKFVYLHENCPVCDTHRAPEGDY